MANELLKSDKLHLFLLLDGTRIDDNEYLKSSNITVIYCTEEHMRKLLIYVYIKKIFTIEKHL